MRNFLFLILLLTPFLSNAQTLDFLFYGGAAKGFVHPITKFGAESPYSLKGSGLKAGLGLNIDFYKANFGLRSGVGFQNKGYSFAIDYGSFPNLKGVDNFEPGIIAYEIPLQFLYKFPLKQNAKIVFNAGPVLSFNNVNSYTFGGESIGIKEDMPAGDTLKYKNNTNAGSFPKLAGNLDLQAGVSLETNRENKSNFGLQIVYQYGFAKMPPSELWGEFHSNNYNETYYGKGETRLSYAAIRLIYKPKFLVFNFQDKK